MKYKSQVVIVGGGGIGLVTGLALARAGICVMIIDQADENIKKDYEFDGRNIALNDASVKFFEYLNLWSELQTKAQPIYDILVSDGDIKNGASPMFLHFDHQHIGTQPFGYFVLYPNLFQALYSKVKQQKNLQLITNRKVKKIDYHDQTIVLTDDYNDSYEAELVLAADGKTSELRKQCGIEFKQHDYQQIAIVCAVAHEKPHKGIAQEFFLPSGPFAILPLQGNKSSIVWVEKRDYAQALMKSDDDIFFYEMQRRFGDYLGRLQIISKRFSYPLIRGHAEKITGKRIIFLGDSAHAIHPISGQGFNLGLRDVAFVAEILEKQIYAGLDIGSEQVTQEYSRMREKDIQLFLEITHFLNGLFSNDVLVTSMARRIGLASVNKISYLRNFFSNAAMKGSISETPKSMC